MRTRGAAAIAAVVFITAPLVAQQTRDVLMVSEARTSAIRGVVTDRNHAPLPNATVRVASAERTGTRSTLTDQAGRFAFETLPAGSYEVSAAKPGYVTEWFGRSASAPDLWRIPVAVDQAVADIAIALGQAASISGTILLDGEPAAAKIGIIPAGSGRLFPGASLSIATDGRGRYRAGDLAPGEYFVAAESLMTGELSISGQDGREQWLALARTYYPGTTRVDAAQVIRVGEGEQRDSVDVQLIAIATGRIIGRATHASGKAVTSLQVIAQSRNGDRRTAQTSGDGEFRFAALPLGDYDIVASGSIGSDEGARERGWARSSASVGAATTTLALELEGGGAIRGRMTVEGAVPRGLAVQIRPLDRPVLSANVNLNQSRAMVGRDGAFSMAELMPGRYAIGFSATEDTQVSVDRITVAGQVAPSSEVIVRSGESLDEVHIHLADSGAEISGTVRNADGTPARGVRIIASPTFPVVMELPMLSRPSTVTDAAGRYRLTSVPKGAYQLRLLDEGREGPPPGPGAGPAAEVVINERGQKRLVDIVRY